MSILSQIEKPAARPVIITICGDSGLGKTNLAATFPKPIFVRAEDGLQGIPAEMCPDALPVIETVDQMGEQFRALLTEDHDYKTVVVDSVTALERLFITHVVDSDPKKPKTINQALGGYGAGLSAVAALHQRVRKICGMMNAKRGLNIVFIAHADTETIELPDQDPYTRYSLRLGKKSMAPYVDDSDVVGFLKLQTFVTGEDGERKKATSTGVRQLVTYATASNVSKNRFGINSDLTVELGKNPLIEYIPQLGE